MVSMGIYISIMNVIRLQICNITKWARPRASRCNTSDLKVSYPYTQQDFRSFRSFLAVSDCSWTVPSPQPCLYCTGWPRPGLVQLYIIQTFVLCSLLLIYMPLGCTYIPQPVYQHGSHCPHSIPEYYSLFLISRRFHEFACGPYAYQRHTPCPASGCPLLAHRSGAWDDA